MLPPVVSVVSLTHQYGGVSEKKPFANFCKIIK